MFKKETGQKVAPKIALRAECSDTAWNHYFRADFLNARLQGSQSASLQLWKVKEVKMFIGGRGASIG